MEADLGHALIAEQIIAFAGMSHKVPPEGMWSHVCIGSIKSKIGTKPHLGVRNTLTSDLEAVFVHKAERKFKDLP